MQHRCSVLASYPKKAMCKRTLRRKRWRKWVPPILPCAFPQSHGHPAASHHLPARPFNCQCRALDQYLKRRRKRALRHVVRRLQAELLVLGLLVGGAGLGRRAGTQ